MKKLTTIILLATVAMTACKKSSNNNNGGTYTLASLKSVAPQEKTVTLDAATGGTFRGNSGSRYIIPANAFINSSGTVVTGNVQVTVNEYLKKSDMVFSGILPISNGEPLISGGEMFIKATQNGTNLLLAPGKTFQVNMPQNGAPVEGMQLFVGQQDSNGVNWIQPRQKDSTAGRIVYNGDTISIINDSFGFCNADQFMAAPDYQSFTVTASAGGVALTDVLTGYAIYDGYNSVWQMMATNKQFAENHVPNIPVHFAVVCIINGDFYAGLLAATPANGSTYNVALTKTTPEAFKAQVDAL